MSARAPFRLLPLARLWLRDIGVPGVIGFLLLALALPAHWALVSRVRAEAAEERAATARARARRVQMAALPAPPPAAAAQLARFTALFPPASALADELSRVERIATAQRVALTSGDYRLAEERGLGMLRYELRFPVKGAWRDIFACIAALLNDMPALALDEVVFKRESRAAAEVEAQLRLSLHFADGAVAPLAAGIVPGAAAGAAADRAPAAGAARSRRGDG